MMASFAVTQSDATPKQVQVGEDRGRVLLLPRVTLLQNLLACVPHFLGGFAVTQSDATPKPQIE